MPTHDVRSHRWIRPFAAAAVLLLGILGCEDDQAPKPLPTGITVASGDNQYTRKGTQLEEPVVVRVVLEGGEVASGTEERFQVIEGGGQLSKSTAKTNGSGLASVQWTVGPTTGTNRMRVTVVDNTGLTATATATSSEYYCVEEDPAFNQKFFPTHELMLVTRGPATGGVAGLLQLATRIVDSTFTTTPLETYPEGTFTNVVRDLAFSTNGDLFICVSCHAVPDTV